MMESDTFRDGFKSRNVVLDGYLLDEEYQNHRDKRRDQRRNDDIPHGGRHPLSEIRPTEQLRSRP